MTPSRATLRRLVRARDVLHASVQRGATLDELAAASGLSRGFLVRSFTRTFGVPPHQMPYGIEALMRDDSGNFYSLTQRR